MICSFKKNELVHAKLHRFMTFIPYDFETNQIERKALSLLNKESIGSALQLSLHCIDICNMHYAVISGFEHIYLASRMNINSLDYNQACKQLENMHRAASKHAQCPPCPPPPLAPDGWGGCSVHLMPTDANVV